MRISQMLAATTAALILGSCGTPAVQAPAGPAGEASKNARYGLLQNGTTCPATCTAFNGSAFFGAGDIAFNLVDGTNGDQSLVTMFIFSGGASYTGTALTVSIAGTVVTVGGVLTNVLNPADQKTIQAVLDISVAPPNGFTIDIDGQDFSGFGTGVIEPGRCTLF